MRIRSLLLGATALFGLFGIGSGAAAALAETTMLDVGGGAPAVRSTSSSKHRRWKKARASGRHDFRKSF